MKFFRENTTLKVLALVVSVVLWSFVKISQGPGSERMQLTLKLPLEVEGRGQDIEVDMPLQVVKVTLRGETRDLDKMPDNFVRARVDVTGLGPGLYPRQVRVVPPGGVELVNVEPAQVTLSVSRRETKNVPVAIVVSGTPAKGMITGTATAEPSTVKVYGPESALREVDHVKGEVVLNQEQQSFTMTVRELIPVDASGRLVNRVSVSAHSVLAGVPIQAISAPTRVVVGADNVRFEHVPGMDYVIKVYPEVVTVMTGPAAKVPRQLLTEAVDFGMVTERARRTLTLSVPEGLSLVSENRVEVEIIPMRKAPSPSPSQSQTASPLRPSPSPNT